MGSGFVQTFRSEVWGIIAIPIASSFSLKVNSLINNNRNFEPQL